MQAFDMQLMTQSAAQAMDSDAALMRRYAQPAPYSQKLACEFTSDPAMLHQYYRLRDMQDGLAGFHPIQPAQDAFDEHSQVIVARSGLLCLGGARLTIATLDMLRVMPMEGRGMRLLKLFPELDLNEVSYAEISCIALMPGRTEKAFSELLAGMLKLVVAEGVEYVFCLSSYPQAHKLKEQMQALDVNCDLRHEVVLPESDDFDGAKQVLSIMDIAKYARSQRVKTRERLLLDEPAA